jgi:hypothetical protein
MLQATLIASWLATLAVTDVAAGDNYTIVMQGTSEPGDAVELHVFVGEQLSYEPKDFDCGEGCWVFDSWHAARYRVVEAIHGVPPGSVLTFDVAEHAVSVPFGHSRYALAFVERLGDNYQLVKYQQVPVYPTTDGSFASCGPLGRAAADDEKSPDGATASLRDVQFSPPLVVDDARRLSGHGRANAYDPRWHSVVGDEVQCRRGIPLPELVRAVVREHEVLKTALPDLAGATR